MLIFKRRINSISVLLCLLLYIKSLSGYISPAKSIYTDKDFVDDGRRLIVMDKHKEHRLKRNIPSADSSIPNSMVHRNIISTWINNLNVSQLQLMVHWVGKGSSVIICLARDKNPKSKKHNSSSAIFISYDYGKTFTNKTEDFKLGDESNSGYAQVDNFYNHPKYPEHVVFLDETNMKLYYSSDNGHNIHRLDLMFHPGDLTFDEENPDKYVILDKLCSNRTLHFTEDGGKTFRPIEDYVKTLWSSGHGFSNMFYLEKSKPNGLFTIFSAYSLEDIFSENIILDDVKDFQINGDYMFATRQSNKTNNLDLYVSHKRGPFFKAEFQTNLDLQIFDIADVTDKRIFVSVMHTENLTNLYVSQINKNYTQYNFVLSLEQIMCYFPGGNYKKSVLKNVTENPFTDLYRVEGVTGIYIASKVDSKTPIAYIDHDNLVSLITYDHGVNWSPIKPPSEDERGMPLNCRIENSCSLHLYQKFSTIYPKSRSQNIMSSKSAPGVIMATGVIGKSLKGIPAVFLSTDAGFTWKRVFKDSYIYKHGDHGGILFAVKYFNLRGETNKIWYSTNDGLEWKSYQFHSDDFRIYDLMTEPGENTTTFTMFGSIKKQRQWVIITVDLKDAFARNCTNDDYEFWSPSPPNSSISCVLGSRNTFQRRLVHTNCYNGIDYERSFSKKKCECTRRDYECDFGFTLNGNECIQNKSLNFYPFAIPTTCQPGEFFERTTGYRKIDGDVCTSELMTYEPETIPCPVSEIPEFMIVSLKDKIIRINLLDNTTLNLVKNKVETVAIEFDIKSNCVYWSDGVSPRINRQCLNGSSPEILVGTDLSSIEGMALDWISHVLFFVDGVRKKIEAVQTHLVNDTRIRVTILDSNTLFKPRGIAVHPKAGYLFWTDWDRNNSSVSRSNLDGTNVKRLFTNEIVQWPNGITIDYLTERIYWVDAKEDHIASSDLDGQDFRKLLWKNNKVSHPFSVAVLKDILYWDDWRAKSIFGVDKDISSNITTIGSYPYLLDLKVFADYIQNGSNACSNKNTSCDALCLGGPGNTFSCLCPDGFNKTSSGKCVCPNGMEPLANMTCPKKEEATCKSDQFTCTNGTCIPASLRCNGKSDCQDSSDENSCPCPVNMIHCDDMIHCYLPTWQCDGDYDCFDRSDEKDCMTKNCTANKFRCATGTCIPKQWLCDGENDCTDGSDELNCTTEADGSRDGEYCHGSFFSCGDRMCIPNTWRCDGDRDCADGSDESKDLCKIIHCSLQMFTCPNGRCIFKSWVCDGENDCGEAEAWDEKNCGKDKDSKVDPVPTAKPTTPAITCLSGFILCSNKYCVPEYWTCSGLEDDNAGGLSNNVSSTTEITPICDSNHFDCAPGMCIPLTWLCDGLADCQNGEDEQYCDNSTVPPSRCPMDESPCVDGNGCVKNIQICDKVQNCADNSDEVLCPEIMIRTPDGVFASYNIAFDDGSDADNPFNVNISRLNVETVYLKWNIMRDVRSYALHVRLPPQYTEREAIKTKDNELILTNLPPGVNIYVDIKTYQKTGAGKSFKLPLIKMGEPDETLNFTVVSLLNDKSTSVKLTWSPPVGEKYKNKYLKYEVHYLKSINARTTDSVQSLNDTKIITKNTSIEIDGLHACETYRFTVGLLGGPLAGFKEFTVRDYTKSLLNNLRINFDEFTKNIKILWDDICEVFSNSATYRVTVTEETFNQTRLYNVTTTTAPQYELIITDVPLGARYNVCLNAAAVVDEVVAQCVRVRFLGVMVPTEVVVWSSSGKHVFVSFNYVQNSRYKYQAIISKKKFPVDFVHVADDMVVQEAESTPILLRVPPAINGTVYVAVRAITPNGYYSDLSEVQTLEISNK